MRIRDVLGMIAAYTLLAVFAPILMIIAIFCEETPEDSYKTQNW